MMVSTIALRLMVVDRLGVGSKAGCASNVVVAPIERAMPASVECGRRLVSISLEVVEALMPADESVTRGVPSARQKASVSSLSTRLHVGQRFIFGVLRLVAAFCDPCGLSV